MADSLKVPADKFKAAIRALLNTPPTPASEIEGKRRYVSDEGKKLLSLTPFHDHH